MRSHVTDAVFEIPSSSSSTDPAFQAMVSQCLRVSGLSSSSIRFFNPSDKCHSWPM